MWAFVLWHWIVNAKVLCSWYPNGIKLHHLILCRWGWIGPTHLHIHPAAAPPLFTKAVEIASITERRDILLREENSKITKGLIACVGGNFLYFPFAILFLSRERNRIAFSVRKHKWKVIVDRKADAFEKTFSSSSQSILIFQYTIHKAQNHQRSMSTKKIWNPHRELVVSSS